MDKNIVYWWNYEEPDWEPYKCEYDSLTEALEFFNYLCTDEDVGRASLRRGNTEIQGMVTKQYLKESEVIDVLRDEIIEDTFSNLLDNIEEKRGYLMFYKLVHGTDKNNLFEEIYYNRRSAYSAFKYMLRHYEWLISKGDLKENYTCLLYTIKEPIDYKQEVKNNAQKLNKKAKRRPL